MTSLKAPSLKQFQDDKADTNVFLLRKVGLFPGWSLACDIMIYSGLIDIGNTYQMRKSKWNLHQNKVIPPLSVNTPPNSQNSKTALSATQYEVPVGKHNNRQHASPHHEVVTDVKQMPIRPIIIIIISVSPPNSSMSFLLSRLATQCCNLSRLHGEIFQIWFL